MEFLKYKLNVIGFGDCMTVAIVEEKKILGAVIFSNFMKPPSGTAVSIEASVLILDKKCCNRHTFHTLFSYPFIHLQVKRLQATCAKRHKRSRRLLERLGFRLEGIGRQAWLHGGDSAFYSMLANECRWLDNVPQSTVRSTSARSSSDISGANRLQ